MKIFPGGFLDKSFNPEIAFFTDEENNLIDNFILSLSKKFDNFKLIRRDHGPADKAQHIFDAMTGVGSLANIYEFKSYLFKLNNKDLNFFIYKYCCNKNNDRSAWYSSSEDSQLYNRVYTSGISWECFYATHTNIELEGRDYNNAINIPTRYTGNDCGELTRRSLKYFDQLQKNIMNYLEAAS
tara:strand:- start:269 stop:817 length:549 start_codon:yes stop_codon:yes gene_type:complete